MFGTSPFFTRLYAETLGLLVEARNYSYLINIDGLQGYPPSLQTKIVHESLRLPPDLPRLWHGYYIKKQFRTVKLAGLERCVKNKLCRRAKSLMISRTMTLSTFLTA